MNGLRELLKRMVEVMLSFKPGWVRSGSEPLRKVLLTSRGARNEKSPVLGALKS